jgi:hypothetical protein
VSRHPEKETAVSEQEREPQKDDEETNEPEPGDDDSEQTELSTDQPPEFEEGAA